MASIRLGFFAGAVVELPQPDGLIAGGGRDVFAIRVKSDSAERPGVAGQGYRVLSRSGQRPDAHQLIDAARSQPLAVGAEANAADGDPVGLPAGALLAGGCIVKANG